MTIQTLGFIIPDLCLSGAERVVARLAEGLSRDFRCVLLLRRGGAYLFPVANVTVIEIDYTAAGIRRAVAQVTEVIDAFPALYRSALLQGQRFAFLKGRPNLLASPFRFARHGDSGAAHALGLHASTLRGRMRKLGIDWKRYRGGSRAAGD